MYLHNIIGMSVQEAPIVHGMVSVSNTLVQHLRSQDLAVTGNLTLPGSAETLNTRVATLEDRLDDNFQPTGAKPVTAAGLNAHLTTSYVAGQKTTNAADIHAAGTLVPNAQAVYSHVDTVATTLETAIDTKLDASDKSADVADINATSTTVPTGGAVFAHVQTAVSTLVDSAPGALDTLNELAAALGDDSSFSATVTTSLNAKVTGEKTSDPSEIVENGTKIPDAHAVAAYVAANGGATGFSAYPIWTYTVTVANGKFLFDGVPSLSFTTHGQYVFDQSDPSNAGHPLRFSAVADGTHGGGSEYGEVSVEGTPGSAGARSLVTFGAATPQLWAYCANHSGMGPADAIGVLGVDAGNYGGGSTIVVNTVNTTEEATVMGGGGYPVWTFLVTVAGGRFLFDGDTDVNLTSYGEYVFDQSDATNAGHQIAFSVTPDGAHGGGVAFTTGVTTTGTPGLADARTSLLVQAGTPALSAYCSSHAGMGARLTVSGMTKANYQLRAPPVGPLQSAANGQKYGLFSSATLNVRSDTDASPPLHATALSANGARVAVGNTLARFVPTTTATTTATPPLYTNAVTTPPVAETIPDWNGGNPALDWALQFKMVAGADWHYAFEFKGANTNNYLHLSTNGQSSLNKQILQWRTATPGGPVGAYAGGHGRIKIITDMSAYTEVEILLSYNSEGYTHDGGGTQPDLATTGNGHGLSYYWRGTTDGGASYDAWNQVLVVGTEAQTANPSDPSAFDEFTEDDDVAWASMTATFQSTVRDVRLWNEVQLPDSPSFPYVLDEIFSPTAGYDAPISPIDATTLGAWHGFQPDKDWAIKISVDPVTSGGTPPYIHQTLWAFTHANGFASLRRFDNWGMVFRWTADDDATALSIGYKTGTAKLTDVDDFEFAIVYDSSNYVSGGGTSPDFADVTFFLKPAGSTSWSEIPKAAETFDNAATDDHMFLYYPPYDNFDGTSATTWSSSGDMIGTFGPEMHGLNAISSTNACGLSSLQLWNQKVAPADFDQANFDQATGPSTDPAPHGAVTVHQQTEAGWSALGAPIYGEVDGAGVGGPGTFQLSADGGRLAVTSLYGTTVHEWDGTTWQKLGATIGGGGANYITVPDVVVSAGGSSTYTYPTIPFSTWTDFAPDKDWEFRAEFKSLDTDSGNGNRQLWAQSNSQTQLRIEKSQGNVGQFLWVLDNFANHLYFQFGTFSYNVDYEIRLIYDSSNWGASPNTTPDVSNFTVMTREYTSGAWGDWTTRTLVEGHDSLDESDAFDETDGNHIVVGGRQSSKWEGYIKNVQFSQTPVPVERQLAFSDDGTRLLVASTNSGVQAYQWVSPDWVAMGGPLADPSETLPQLAMSGDGACAAIASRAATVTSPVYLHTEELQPGSYKNVPGTELGGWKGAFDYDQGVYFRVTTSSSDSSIIAYPFRLHSGTLTTLSAPQFNVFCTPTSINLEIFQSGTAMLYAAKPTTLSLSTEYEAYVTWHAMGSPDATAPDASDFIIAHRAVGGTWDVGSPSTVNADSINMFSSSGETTEYFGLEGNESGMFLAINNHNGVGGFSVGTLHKLAFYNEYITEALLDETLAAAEAALSNPGGVSVYDWSASSSTWTPRAALPFPEPPTPVNSPVYVHSTELTNVQFEVLGTELGGWKGAFDYDQGIYFRFTTNSSGSTVNFIGCLHSGTATTRADPYMQVYCNTNGIYFNLSNNSKSFESYRNITLSHSTEYEGYVTWHAMGPPDSTAPDASDITIGYRTIGGTWSVDVASEPWSNADLLGMFDSSGNTADYFSLVGNESNMRLAIGHNGNHNAPGTTHKLALYNAYITEALLEETLSEPEPPPTPIPSTVALNADGSRLVTTVDASYTTTGNTPYRYWGVGNAAGGTWTNNFYVFIWATFKDASGAILNDDRTYYAQWTNTYFPSTFAEGPSNDPANYLVHSFPSAHFNDPSAHYGHRVAVGHPPAMHEQWQWNGSNPLFYVDLGEPKDVRTVQHLGADNHVMKDLIVVASHDRVNWTIVFTPPSDSAYNRIVDIPFTPETFHQDDALVYDWDTQALAWGQPGPAITVDQGASPHLSGDGGRLMVASADSTDLYELDTSGASLKLFEIDIDQPPAGHVITHEGPRTSATAVSYTGWNGFSADNDWTLLITIQFPSPIVHDVKFFNFVDTSYSDIYGYTKKAYLWMHRESVNTLQFTWAGHPTSSLNAQLEKRLNSTSMALCAGKTVTFAFVYDSTNFRASVSSAPDNSDLKWYMTIPEDNVDWHEPATTSDFDNWDQTDGSGMTGIGDLNFGPDSSSGGTTTDLILYNAALTATELPNAGLTATGTPPVSMSRDGTKLAIPTDADGGMVRFYDILAYSAPATLSGTAGGNYAGGWRLHVDNAIQLQLATDGVTVYNGALTAPSFATSSDDRLKHNEKDITDALAAVRRLTPRCYDKTYKLPRNVRELRTLPTRPEAGLVAQEVQQVPELARFVTADPNGMLGVDYNSIFTYMLAAVKQLDAKVQRLKQA